MIHIAMHTAIILCVLFSMSSFIHEATCLQGLRRDIFKKDEFHYLNVRKVGTYTAHDVFDCTFECLSNLSCFSFNLAAAEGAEGKLWCELLSGDKHSNPSEYKGNQSSHHFFTENPCRSSPCQNQGTCVTSHKDDTFNCKCKAGFIGKYCETLVRSSCKSLYAAIQSNVSQLVNLTLDSKPTSVLCQLGDFGCGAGGWTPVMKIDGKKQTFHHGSTLWTNKQSFNLAGGASGFDTEETKLPTYWITSFSKICLGMKIGQKINFVVISKQADSLYSLIADGQYRATSIGRDAWISLIGYPDNLQPHCNMEGFNTVSTSRFHRKARIGLLANEQNDCHTCDSYIGFGSPSPNTCGNGNRKAMGYILVE